MYKCTSFYFTTLRKRRSRRHQGRVEGSLRALQAATIRPMSDHREKEGGKRQKREETREPGENPWSTREKQQQLYSCPLNRQARESRRGYSPIQVLTLSNQA